MTEPQIATDILVNMPRHFPLGTSWLVERDDFVGTVVGWYVTREGKTGVVLQQIKTKIVHVYNSKWLDPC